SSAVMRVTRTREHAGHPHPGACGSPAPGSMRITHTWRHAGHPRYMRPTLVPHAAGRVEMAMTDGLATSLNTVPRRAWLSWLTIRSSLICTAGAVSRAGVEEGQNGAGGQQRHMLLGEFHQAHRIRHRRLLRRRAVRD